MTVVLEVTDRALYETRINHVELDGLTADNSELFSGYISIYSKAKGVIPYFGLIESTEFQEEFGFLLLSKEKKSTGMPKTV